MNDYYPFGLTMPGRSANTANPNDTYKFTSYENDDEGGLDLYHANARGYDPVLGRFMQVDPMSHLYPGISPFAYAMNNPLLYIDPTGETIECTTQESCQNAADDINKTHEGAGMEVVEKQRTVTTGFLWRKKETTETYYELTTGNEDFDWSQGGTDDFGSAVYDILASEDVVMNVIYTTGDIPESKHEANRSPISGPGGYGGGLFDRGNFAPASDGGTVYVDPRGHNGEPSAVILMHEMLGHGHSVGGVTSPNPSQNALKVNNHYLKKLGLSKRRGGGHGGFSGSPRFNK